MTQAETSPRRIDMAPRYPSGRLKQPNATERAAIERAALEQEMHTVRNQPHRRGSIHPWAGSALGRFCLAKKLSVHHFDAATAFAVTYKAWQAARGIPTDERAGGGITGEGPSAATVKRWYNEIRAVHRMMCGISGRFDHYRVLMSLTVDRPREETWDLPEWDHRTGVLALHALAHHVGKPVGKHPYA